MEKAPPQTKSDGKQLLGWCSKHLDFGCHILLCKKSQHGASDICLATIFCTRSMRQYRKLHKSSLKFADSSASGVCGAFALHIFNMQTTLASWKPLAAPTRVPRITTQRHAFHNISHSSMPALQCSTFAKAAQRPALSRASSSKALPIQAAQASPARKQPKNRPQHKTNTMESDFWTKLFSRLAKAAALFALAAGIALGGARPAEAARSGGRIGGSSFGRSSFGSSMGSSSAFGGRSSFGGGSSSSSFGSGRSSLGLSPYRSSVSTNSFFFFPFGGLGYGYGYGYPVGGGFTSLLFWGVFAVIMVQVVRGVLGQSSYTEQLDDGEVLSVAKVQVGLLGSARELQLDLERIASQADTASSRGLHYILQETVLALLRNPNYCVYGFAKSGIENSADEAEARFNKLSLEERGKFEKETRVNVAGRTSRSSLNMRQDLSAPVNELIVVTILIAAEGRMRLPKVTGRKELVEALTTLGAVPATSVLAVEILWTPEEEDDYFTQEDLAADYPLMNTL